MRRRDATKTYTNDHLLQSTANRREETPQSAAPVDSLQSAYVESRRAMLYSENFATLDSEADDLLASKARFPGGAWKLRGFFAAVGGPIGGYDVLIDRSSSTDDGNGVSADPKSASESAWLRHLSVLRRWQSARPQSSTAVLALARAFTNYAWLARGTGYADTVTDEHAKVFHERVGEAKRLLSQYGPIVSRNPEFCCLMITIAMAEGRASKDVQKVVSEPPRTP